MVIVRKVNNNKEIETCFLCFIFGLLHFIKSIYVKISSGLLNSGIATGKKLKQRGKPVGHPFIEIPECLPSLRKLKDSV